MTKTNKNNAFLDFVRLYLPSILLLLGLIYAIGKPVLAKDFATKDEVASIKIEYTTKIASLEKQYSEQLTKVETALKNEIGNVREVCDKILLLLADKNKGV